MGLNVEMCGWCNLTEKEKRWLLADTEYWSIYLADEQDYIGRCLVILNGNGYADAEYGHLYRLSKGVFIPEEDMVQLLHLLKSNLHLSAKACREFEEKGIC